MSPELQAKVDAFMAKRLARMRDERLHGAMRKAAEAGEWAVLRTVANLMAKSAADVQHMAAMVKQPEGYNIALWIDLTEREDARWAARRSVKRPRVAQGSVWSA